MLLERSPWATAPITRATSLEGCTRSSISELMEFDRVAPEAGDIAQRRALLELALLADHAAQARQLLPVAGVELDHVVEGVGHLACHPGQSSGSLAVSSPRRTARSAASSSLV